MRPTVLYNTVKYLKQILNSNKVEERQDDHNYKLNGHTPKCDINYITLDNGKNDTYKSNEQKLRIENETQQRKKDKEYRKLSFHTPLLACAAILVFVFVIVAVAKTVDRREEKKTPIDFIIRAPRHPFEGLSKCEICKAGVTVIQSLLSMNVSESEVAKGITNFCIRLRIEDKKICQGIVKVYKIEVLTVLDNLALSPHVLCGVIRLCPAVKNPFPLWNVTLPNVPKPPLEDYRESDSPPMLVLHISDIHVDFRYTEGSEARCNEPVCCRGKQNNSEPYKSDSSTSTRLARLERRILSGSAWGGPRSNWNEEEAEEQEKRQEEEEEGRSTAVKEPAGHWGMYRNCDTPPKLVDHLFSHLANTKWDYIIWTGDTPGHNVWNQTKDVQLNTLTYITEKLATTFPGIKVLPALGNHESSPVNSYPQPFVKGSGSIQWLYDALADHWIKLGLSPSTAANITRGGFYTELVKPGFRVISLNMNYCNTLNWWLLLNTTDPAGQLKWFVEVLQTAETAGEKVHVIGHIPPGDEDCMKAWSWNYYKIVNRYEGTITGQFFGHTHFDSFQMFYTADAIIEDHQHSRDLQSTPSKGQRPSPSTHSSAPNQPGPPNDLSTPELWNSTTRRPSAVAYIAPSVTTFNDLNPGYRTYSVDSKFWHVLDHSTYVMNLTRANEGHPEWTFEYSARDAYNLDNLTPQSWHNLLGKFFSNDSTLQKFYNHYWKSHSPSPHCDSTCRNNYVCELISGRSHDPAICRGLNVSTQTYRQHLEVKKFC